MQALRSLANNRASGSLAHRMRSKRFQQFQTLLQRLPRPISILDVGGEQEFWRMMGIEPDDGLQITLLNLSVPQDVAQGFFAVAGDARSMPEFADKSFDIVFSNSVIEHVGSWEDQQKMAREVRRIGKRYFVQTPNYYFPIEPHFLFPGFQFLPSLVQRMLVQNFSLGWYEKIPERTEVEEFLRGFRLLSRRELQQLFPEATLLRERFFGMNKSYTAVYGWDY